MNSDKIELRVVQLRYLDILKEVDKVCREHDVKYYIAAGTMLGAVRHGGFIPWDDDIDIAMPRPDYERFLKIAKDILPKHLVAKNYLSDKDFLFRFMKVEDNRTTLHEQSHLKYVGGIGIDVFCLDGIPSSKFKQRIHLLKFKVFNKLRYFSYRDPYKDGIGLKFIVPFLVQCLFSRVAIHRVLDNISKEYDYEKSDMVSEHDKYGSSIKFFPKSVFCVPTPVKFEDASLLGPERADEYLTVAYGDYMKIPDVPDRRQHVRMHLDLNAPCSK